MRGCTSEAALFLHTAAVASTLQLAARRIAQNAAGQKSEEGI